MSLEHGAPATKLYEDDAFKHLFADVDVVYPEDNGYRWDHQPGTTEDNGRKIYFVPATSAPRSGETRISTATRRAPQPEIIKADGLGIFPPREHLRLTRGRALFGAAAVASVCAGIGAAYMTESLPYVSTPNHASDVPDVSVDPDKKPSATKSAGSSRPENPAPTYQPVVVYENYQSPQPSHMPEVTPSATAPATKEAAPSKHSPSPEADLTTEPTSTRSAVPSQTTTPAPSETLPTPTSSPTESVTTSPDETLPVPTGSAVLPE